MTYQPKTDQQTVRFHRGLERLGCGGLVGLLIGISAIWLHFFPFKKDAEPEEKISTNLPDFQPQKLSISTGQPALEPMRLLIDFSKVNWVKRIGEPANITVETNSDLEKVELSLGPQR